jgi:hypothetical protein
MVNGRSTQGPSLVTKRLRCVDTAMCKSCVGCEQLKESVLHLERATLSRTRRVVLNRGTFSSCDNKLITGRCQIIEEGMGLLNMAPLRRWSAAAVVLLVVACLGGVRAQNSTANTTAVDVCPAAKWRVSTTFSTKAAACQAAALTPRRRCPWSQPAPVPLQHGTHAAQL